MWDAMLPRSDWQSSATARVAKLVDARDLKSRAARRAGSTPALGTITHTASSVCNGLFIFEMVEADYDPLP